MHFQMGYGVFAKIVKVSFIGTNCTNVQLVCRQRRIYI